MKLLAGQLDYTYLLRLGSQRNTITVASNEQQPGSEPYVTKMTISFKHRRWEYKNHTEGMPLIFANEIF